MGEVFRLAFPRSLASMLIIGPRIQATKIFLQLMKGPEAMGDSILLNFGHLCIPKGQKQQLREEGAQIREGVHAPDLIPEPKAQGVSKKGEQGYQLLSSRVNVLKIRYVVLNSPIGINPY